MRYLGIDLGTKTLGVSLSDKTGMMATPYITLFYPNEEYEKVLQPLKKIVEEKEITDFVLGLPKNMDNSLGFAAKRSLDFAKLLEQEFKLPIHFVDERLTSVEANNILLSTNMKRIKRKRVVDNVASAIILDTFLKERRIESERKSPKE